MPQLSSLALALLTLLAWQSSALARGRGMQSYLLTNDGQLAATLGETSGDLLDPAAFVRYRYHEGRVTATPLDKPDEVLWSAAAKPQLRGRAPLWRLLPTLLVIIGEDTITAIDRASGKLQYTTDADGFARSLYPTSFAGERETPPAPTLYLIDFSAQEKTYQQGKKFPTVPARLARFDLTTGKFLWKTNIVTAAGKIVVPVDLDPRGIVEGMNQEDPVQFAFDPATGKALDKAPLATDTPRDLPLPPRAPRVQTSDDKLDYVDAAGKTIWSRREPGVKGEAFLTADSVVIPCVTGRSTTQVLAYDRKDGKERWRTPLPLGRFADQVTVRVEQAKTGYLIQVEWIVLD